MKVNNIELPAYSVLMSVYDGEKAEYLKESIDSMLMQTYPADDFVLVCDGGLTRELDELVNAYERENENFTLLRLDEKTGTGGCANAGLELCKNEYIVKMDSDDIALPERCELSLYAMAKHPEIDILGAYIEEFDSVTGDIIAVKKTPSGRKEILKYAKRRNPFNNQTLVYKKSAALKIGGYSDIKRCEDYDFVVRMLSNGAVGANLKKVLVKYRVTEGNYNRRRNWANTKSFIAVRWRIHKSGFSSLWDFIVPTAVQLVLFILPVKMTGLIYKKLLRK